MAKKKDTNQTAEALRDMEATGDKVAEWAADNAALILGAIAGILVIAAGAGFWLQHASGAREAAASELAATTAQYRTAMGADASGPIPEPANASVAETTRREYAERFDALASEHAGTASGSIAQLEAAGLHLQLGDEEAAITRFEAARDGAGSSAIGALAGVRLAGLAEARGDLAAAAAAYEAAAGIAEFPLRAKSLADAARCRIQAGETDQALALFQRFESEFPDEVIPAAVKAQLSELRVRSGL